MNFFCSDVYLNFCKNVKTMIAYAKVYSKYVITLKLLIFYVSA